MAISTPDVKKLTDLELMSHLYRRAGFGATRDELEAALARGYEAVVEELLHPEAQPPVDDFPIYRYRIDIKEARRIDSAQAHWIYYMINSRRPLEEKMTLFWHSLFATAYSKGEKARTMANQIRMLRKHCLGDFPTLLAELSKDGAMIYWLDNQENTKDVHNENYGRELLELFSMGRGNYTEDDVKNCARAFTGWGLKKTVPGFAPFSHFDMEFQFYPEQHDYGEKVFLGERGNFDGTDIIDIIVRQPATARFIAMRLYKFFVSDEPDEDAVAELARMYQQSNYDIRAIVRALFMSDFFRSEKAYYAKVKSPAELVVGVTRLVGDFQAPDYGLTDLANECRYMGQDLMNPPSVEGWHTGKEWIDTGILVERINWASEQVGNVNKRGVRRIIERLKAEGELTPEQFVERCLDLLGPLPVSPSTYEALLNYANHGGPLRLGANGDGAAAEQRVSRMLQMIVASREYQLV